MSYAEAKAKYAALGIDTDAVIEQLKTVPVALHCWQGDDVRGFDTDPTKPLTGGIQTTGNYPGKEVVQVYYSAPKGKITKSSIELSAFYKTKIFSGVAYAKGFGHG